MAGSASFDSQATPVRIRGTAGAVGVPSAEGVVDRVRRVRRAVAAVGVTRRVGVVCVRAQLTAIVPRLVIQPRRIGGKGIRRRLIAEWTAVGTEGIVQGVRLEGASGSVGIGRGVRIERIGAQLAAERKVRISREVVFPWQISAGLFLGKVLCDPFGCFVLGVMGQCITLPTEQSASLSRNTHCGVLRAIIERASIGESGQNGE